MAPFLRDVRLVRTFAGDAVPREPDGAEAVVVLGGGMGVYEQDRLPHLRDELALLRACVERQVPVLGICLGAQLLASALGARVAPAGSKEIGFYRVKLEVADPLFAGLDDSFVAFHWHGDAFALPPGAVPLASSGMTPLQAFRFGERSYGIQFHLEVDESTLGAMVGSGDAELREEGVDPDALLAQASRELPRIRPIAAAVFQRFANQVESGRSRKGNPG